MRKLRIGITGVDHISGNRGVGALALSIFQILRKCTFKSEREIEITEIGNNFGTKIIEINGEEVNVACVKSVSLFSVKEILRLLTNPKKIASFLHYYKLDVIFCMGEGDSFSDIYGEHRFNAINDQHRMARFFRKRYLLLPQTIGPFKDQEISRAASKSIESSGAVLTRDRMSYEYVLAHTKQENVKELIDVAFFLPYLKRNINNGKLNVGLNISSLMWHGGYTKDNQFGFKVNYSDIVRQMIDYFLSTSDVQIHLVPHVVLASPHVENDYEVSRIIQDEYHSDRITLAPFFLDPIEAKSYISGLDFFVGARMHACIAAFSSGVPTFPIAYSRKFNGLFVETLRYPYIGDLVNQTGFQILDGLKSAFEDRLLLENLTRKSLDEIVAPSYTYILNELNRFLEKV